MSEVVFGGRNIILMFEYFPLSSRGWHPALSVISTIDQERDER